MIPKTFQIGSKGMDVEAAGATKMLKQKRSSRIPVNFEANQPFLYMITANDYMIQYAGVFN
jgi:hypothetical protein